MALSNWIKYGLVALFISGIVQFVAQLVGSFPVWLAFLNLPLVIWGLVALLVFVFKVATGDL